MEENRKKQLSFIDKEIKVLTMLPKITHFKGQSQKLNSDWVCYLYYSHHTGQPLFKRLKLKVFGANALCAMGSTGIYKQVLSQIICFTIDSV